ncbi:unnamed protein product [Amoebophrya sp. A25]|nr:unnamed protein product [Amoebophrya sp. A25]|eukprot:GSA25T00021735001.1
MGSSRPGAKRARVESQSGEGAKQSEVRHANGNSNGNEGNDINNVGGAAAAGTGGLSATTNKPTLMSGVVVSGVTPTMSGAQQQQQQPLRKILAVGSAHGEWRRTFSVAEEYHRKQKFEFMLACGSFLGSKAQMAPYLANGDSKVPLPTYFIDAESTMFVDRAYHGKTVADKLHFLGGCGLREIDGLRVAFLSGTMPRMRDGTIDWAAFNQCCVVPDDEPAKFTSYENRDGVNVVGYTRSCIEKIAQLAEGKPVDILLTSEWPAKLTSELSDDEVTHAGRSVPAEDASSPAVSELVRLVQPRWHFFANEGRYFKRRPFLVPDKTHLCISIGLCYAGEKSEATSEGKPNKGLHAIQLRDTISRTPADVLLREKDRETATACPFVEGVLPGVEEFCHTVPATVDAKTVGSNNVVEKSADEDEDTSEEEEDEVSALSPQEDLANSDALIMGKGAAAGAAASEGAASANVINPISTAVAKDSSVEVIHLPKIGAQRDDEGANGDSAVADDEGAGEAEESPASPEDDEDAVAIRLEAQRRQETRKLLDVDSRDIMNTRRRSISPGQERDDSRDIRRETGVESGQSLEDSPGDPGQEVRDEDEAVEDAAAEDGADHDMIVDVDGNKAASDDLESLPEAFEAGYDIDAEQGTNKTLLTVKVAPEKTVVFQTGKVACRASGSAFCSQGDTQILATACCEPRPRPFFAKAYGDNPADSAEAALATPLTVEYKEKWSAMGLTMPNHERREKIYSSDHETLISRLVDRPLRPVFPEWWNKETKVTLDLMSGEQAHLPDALAINAASMALLLSDVPFGEAVAGVTVAGIRRKLPAAEREENNEYQDAAEQEDEDENSTTTRLEFVVFPTRKEREEAELILVAAGTASSVSMLEASANFSSEDDFIQALEVAQETIATMCEAMDHLARLRGKEKQKNPEGEALAAEKEEQKKALLALGASSTSGSGVEGITTSNMEGVVPGDASLEGVGVLRPELDPHRLLSDLARRFTPAVVSLFREASKLPAWEHSENVWEFFRTQVLTTYRGTSLYAESLLRRVFRKFLGLVLCDFVRQTGQRLDGRSTSDLRPLDIEPHYLPGPHGCCLFSVEGTQTSSICTLGDSSTALKADRLFAPVVQGPLQNGGDTGSNALSSKRTTSSGPDTNSPLAGGASAGEPARNPERFFFQYTLPAYSVNEVRQRNTRTRLEVGHEDLAERALRPCIPAESDDWPYTMRVESTVMESCGGSSMSSVCGGCLALVDAGVPITSPVAGVSLGLLTSDIDLTAAETAEQGLILTDITQFEDSIGLMDFKVAGNRSGISAMQLDVKNEGLTLPVFAAALKQAQVARSRLLDEMEETIEVSSSRVVRKPRLQMLRFAIPPESKGRVIGPGGSSIRKMEATFGISMQVNETSVELMGKNLSDLHTAKTTVLEAVNRGMEFSVDKNSAAGGGSGAGGKNNGGQADDGEQQLTGEGGARRGDVDASQLAPHQAFAEASTGSTMLQVSAPALARPQIVGPAGSHLREMIEFFALEDIKADSVPKNADRYEAFTVTLLGGDPQARRDCSEKIERIIETVILEEERRLKVVCEQGVSELPTREDVVQQRRDVDGRDVDGAGDRSTTRRRARNDADEGDADEGDRDNIVVITIDHRRDDPRDEDLRPPPTKKAKTSASMLTSTKAASMSSKPTSKRSSRRGGSFAEERRGVPKAVTSMPVIGQNTRGVSVEGRGHPGGRRDQDQQEAETRSRVPPPSVDASSIGNGAAVAGTSSTIGGASPSTLVNVPRDKQALVLGKKGSTIKKLRDRFAVEDIKCRSDPRFPEKGYCEIIGGTQAQREACALAIQELQLTGTTACLEEPVAAITSVQTVADIMSGGGRSSGNYNRGTRASRGSHGRGHGTSRGPPRGRVVEQVEEQQLAPGGVQDLEYDDIDPELLEQIQGSSRLNTTAVIQGTTPRQGRGQGFQSDNHDAGASSDAAMNGATGGKPPGASKRDMEDDDPGWRREMETVASALQEGDDFFILNTDVEATWRRQFLQQLSKKYDLNLDEDDEGNMTLVKDAEDEE